MLFFNISSLWCCSIAIFHRAAAALYFLFALNPARQWRFIRPLSDEVLKERVFFPTYRLYRFVIQLDDVFVL